MMLLSVLSLLAWPEDPKVHYTLRVDPADFTSYQVSLRISGAPDTFTVAMAAHPEYDDKFWRHVEDLRISAGSITRTDSSLWHVRLPGGAGIVSYRIRPPATPAPRPAWTPYIDSTGVLMGGPHSFMYITRAPNVAATLGVDVPSGWSIATGLETTREPGTFKAPSIHVLVESPVMAGRLSHWSFTAGGAPHQVTYWKTAGGPGFDSTAFVDGIRRFAEQAIAMFGGKAPWREYAFMFRDAAWGGLEHANSVTLGAQSRDLAKNPHHYLRETAHEFFHAWNLMRIRPAEYQGLTWKQQPPTSGLWFSEGLTIFYADVLRRRAGLPTEDSTRAAHLSDILGAWILNPGYSRLSAEQVSRAAYNSTPAALGDYTAGTHLQGEVIGAMLDIVIRDVTDGRKSMDDVMRLMLQRFSGERGFLGPDIERTIEEVCGCDVTPFFDAHVRGAGPLDFNRYLALIGLEARTTWAPAMNNEGKPAVDLWFWGYQDESDGSLRVRVGSPERAWGRAGLHTGDKLVSVNGAAVRTWPELRNILRRVRIGDTVRVSVSRPAGPFEAMVVATGYDEPRVEIHPVAAASTKARRLRETWTMAR